MRFLDFWVRVGDGFLQDLRVAIRVSLRTPMVTGLAVIAIALGIGANTAVFSVIHAVLVPRLDYREADRLVQVGTWIPSSGPDSPYLVMAERYFEYRDQASAFEALVAVKWEGYVLEGASRFTNVLAVGNGFFSMFGIQPFLGRTLSPSPDVQVGMAGVNLEMMLSYELWQSRFGGDSTVVGRTVVLDHWGAEDDAHNRRTIVGVLPPGFVPPRYRARQRLVGGTAEAVVPLSEARWFGSQPNSFPFNVFGRLRPGVSPPDAEAQLQAISDRLASEFPGEAELRVQVTPLSALSRSLYGRPMSLLWGVVGAVLLIACLNVACLMLARSASRDGEFAVRASLGAPPGRVARQLITESLLIAAAGALLGLLLAAAGTRGVIALFPGSIAGLSRVAINGPVLLVTLLLSLVTVGLFGWAPPLVASRVDLAERLKGVFGRASMGSGRLLRALVGVEAALALVLFIGAGLFLNSFVRLTRVETGFDIENVLAIRTERAPDFMSRYGSDANQIPVTVLHDRMREAVRGLPGVESVAIVAGPNGIPFTRYEVNAVTVEDRHRAGSEDNLEATWTNVDPSYFDVMGVPLLTGSTFSSGEVAEGALVAIVSESAARRFWPGAVPLGKVITYGHQDLDAGVVDTRYPLPRLYTVVGVVGDVVTADVERGPDLTVYTPLTQSYYAQEVSTVVIRSSSDFRGLAEEARAAVLAVDESELEVTSVTSMSNAFREAVAEPRFYAVLLGLLAAVALVLVLAGVYGVVAYGVRRRTYELGIRMALGAEPDQVRNLVLRDGMMPVLAGLAVGVVGSVFLGRYVAGYLFGVEPGDPVTIGVTCALVGGMAVIACYVPARAAARVSPSELLRTE